MEMQFQANDVSDSDEELEEKDHRKLNQLVQEPMGILDKDIRAISLKEFLQTIEILSVRKAPRLDAVLNRTLKHLPRRVIAALRIIINFILRLCYFSNLCMNADFPKSGENLVFPQSYW